MKVLLLSHAEVAAAGAMPVTRSGQKALQNLYAKALRRALRRFRSGGERRTFQ